MKKKYLISIILLIIIIASAIILNYNIKNNTTWWKEYKRSLSPELKNNLNKKLISLNKKWITYKKNFKFNKKGELSLKIDNEEINLDLYTNSILRFTGPRSYMASSNNNLFLMTGNGTLMFLEFDKIKKKNIKFKKIKTNLSELLFPYQEKARLDKETMIVKNIMTKDNKLYVSYIKKIDNNCYKNSIVSGSINKKKIIFSEFFILPKCRPYFSNGSGGNLSNYKNNEILMTIGDWEMYEHIYYRKNPEEFLDVAQTIDNPLGKIIAINVDKKDYRILSMGHRNPQGLYYDKKDDLIFSAEHGPTGGDEVNLIQNSNNNILKNFGWPRSSYGEHYQKKDKTPGKVAPLNKSHSDYDFIEPLHFWTPSIGVSDVVRYKNNLFVGGMGGNIKEGDLSIHKLRLSNDNKVIKHTVFPVNDRVRDIFILKELNQIVFYLETTGTLAFLNVGIN